MTLARSWQVLSRGPSGDRIARSCRHTGPNLTIRIGVKDRIARLLLSQYVLDFWGLFPAMIECPEIKRNNYRIAKQFLRHYRFLSQTSCRLSRRDRRQLSQGHPDLMALSCCSLFLVFFSPFTLYIDTKYDWARGPLHSGSAPRPPLVV